MTKSLPKNTSSKDSKETLAIDFDGVLAYYQKGWFDSGILGNPIDGVKQAIVQLKKKYTLVVFTCREPKKVKWWMRHYGIPLMKVTNKKPGAIAYIDDRAVKFTSWQDILNDYN